MHAAHFFILDAEQQLTSEKFLLSKEISEWLINIGFWDDFNDAHGTFFGHYEEWILSINLLPIMEKSLSELIEKTQEIDTKIITFQYGWNDKKESLCCSVDIKKMLIEIRELCLFMKQAIIANSEVLCQL